jgi:hypothetical protein
MLPHVAFTLVPGTPAALTCRSSLIAFDPAFAAGIASYHPVRLYVRRASIRGASLPDDIFAPMILIAQTADRDAARTDAKTIYDVTLSTVNRAGER